MLYKIRWKGYDESEDTWQKFADVKGTAAYENWLLLKKNITNKKK